MNVNTNMDMDTDMDMYMDLDLNMDVLGCRISVCSDIGIDLNVDIVSRSKSE
jgi:hypothetical protein